jgi:RNA polymerase sigma-70 factor (ECF subfamily)
MSEFRQEAQWKTWIYRITINHSLDKIKSRKARKRNFWLPGIALQPEQQTQLPVFNHPGILLEHKESLKLLFTALNQLAENQKTAIILLKISNLPQKQAAEIMKLSEKALESLFYRAKKNLLNLLNESKG